MAALQSLALLVALSGVGQAPQRGEIVLLDFTLENCAPCAQMAPVLGDLARRGYPIRQVDSRQHPELVQQFHVDAFPTYVLTAGGQEVDRAVGVVDSRRIVQMFSRAQSRTPPAQAPTAQSIMTADAAGDNGPTTFRGQSPDAGRAANTFPGQPTRYALAGAVASAPVDAPRDTASADAFTAALVQSTVRLRVDDPDGHSYGTGTIIDAREGEALVLTCGHIFRDSHGQGPITVDAMVDGVARALAGQLIRYDEKRDLGFVSIRPSGAVRAARVASDRWRASLGEPVWSVGCNGGGEPSVEATRVTAIDRYTGSPNVEIDGMPVEGRSGGGLFNELGEVIGVCFAADPEHDEGLYAAADSIHSELDRLGLAQIYRADPSESFAASAPTPITPASLPQEVAPGSRLEPSPFSTAAPADFPPATAVANSGRQSPTAPVQHAASGASADPLAGLSPNERTVLAELSARSAGRQVICIIQPEAPGTQSEILVLNNASSTLLEQLAALRPAASSARLTSLDVDNDPGVAPASPAAGWGAGR